MSSFHTEIKIEIIQNILRTEPTMIFLTILGREIGEGDAFCLGCIEYIFLSLFSRNSAILVSKIDLVKLVLPWKNILCRRPDGEVFAVVGCPELVFLLH